LVYKWKNYKYSVPAEVVGKHFQKLEKKEGALTSQNVLESARSEKSPIHSLFEWDDTKAAEQYRLKQAAQLICNLTVEIETEDKPIECRAYMDVSEAKVGSFINVQSAFQSEESRDVVLKRALNELSAFKTKYKNLLELQDVFDVIDTHLEAI
jgi:hypothetical protein